MQWTAGPESGFTTSSHPWLPIPPSAKEDNVATEEKDPDSIFNTYKRLLFLRKTEPALRDGSYESVDNDNPYVFSFLRKSGNETVLVSLNMSDAPRTVSLKLSGYAKPLYHSPAGDEKAIPLQEIELPAFGVLVATVQ
jgi:glycosidase